MARPWSIVGAGGRSGAGSLYNSFGVPDAPCRLGSNQLLIHQVQEHQRQIFLYWLMHQFDFSEEVLKHRIVCVLVQRVEFSHLYLGYLRRSSRKA